MNDSEITDKKRSVSLIKHLIFFWNVMLYLFVYENKHILIPISFKLNKKDTCG